MRLLSFSVVNYRSITNARKIQTHNMTVLVGKNNEGKSNILRSLKLHETRNMMTRRWCLASCISGNTQICNKGSF